MLRVATVTPPAGRESRQPFVGVGELGRQNMKHEQATATEITTLAGRALFISQNVEYYMTLMCRMLNSKVPLAPRHDLTLFGYTQERTASLKDIKKALNEFGIDASHYLFPEIEDFIKRRDWLAHRLYIDRAPTRAETRTFQKQGLDELIRRAFILLGVIIGVSKLIAEADPEIQPLPSDHMLSRLCKKHELESVQILELMKMRKSMHETKNSIGSP